MSCFSEKKNLLNAIQISVNTGMGSTAVSMCMLLIATEVWLVERGWLKSVGMEDPFLLILHQEEGSH